ncbi:hypothetical protein [Blastomonas fulva]|jgi:hypothetical protein|uniref:hypothetical protein n=1 Tax=Blastomonas fulva TaxID=1550728 RepID=UPI003D2D7662
MTDLTPRAETCMKLSPKPSPSVAAAALQMVRRNFGNLLAGAVGLALLAGCSDNTDDEANTEDGSGTTAIEPSGDEVAPEGEAEVSQDSVAAAIMAGDATACTNDLVRRQIEAQIWPVARIQAKNPKIDPEKIRSEIERTRAGANFGDVVPSGFNPQTMVMRCRFGTVEFDLQATSTSTYRLNIAEDSTFKMLVLTAAYNDMMTKMYRDPANFVNPDEFRRQEADSQAREQEVEDRAAAEQASIDNQRQQRRATCLQEAQAEYDAEIEGLKGMRSDNQTGRDMRRAFANDALENAKRNC